MNKKVMDRIAELLRSFRSESAEGFKGDYREFLSDGARTGELKPEELEALERISESLAGWYASDTPNTATSPVTDWLHLAAASKNVLPNALLEGLFARIPASALSDYNWDEAVLQSGDPRFIALLIGRKIIKKTDLVRMAKEKPEAFYRSAGLDALLDMRVCPPRAVWTSLAAGATRETGLLPCEEAVAEAYASDKAADATVWLAELVSEYDALSRPVVQQLLRDLSGLRLLSRQIVLPVKGKKGDRAREVLAELAKAIREACVEAVVERKRTAVHAEWIVSVIVLAGHAPESNVPNLITKIFDEATTEISRHRVTAILRSADRGESVEDFPIVASGSSLHEFTDTFMQELPVGSDSDVVGRGARYQRYLGRKDVITEVLALAHANTSRTVPREALEVALYNVGVRPLTVTPDNDGFDPLRHEGAVSGILPGDRVRLESAGWQLGDDSSAIVLERARVRPF